MHECVVVLCQAKVPSDHLMCSVHWQALPENLRTALNRARNLQRHYRTKDSEARYLRLARHAAEHVSRDAIAEAVRASGVLLS